MRTGDNGHVIRWNGHPLGSGPSGKFERHAPHICIDRKGGERSGEFSQNLLFLVPASAVPEFQLDQLTPAGLPARQRCLDTGVDSPIASWAKHVNPGRGIDENHRLNPASARREALGAKSGLRRCQHTE